MARHDAFRAAVEAGDLDAMRACFADGATFHSPAVHEPYTGVDAVLTVLAAVTTVFEDFAYVGELAGDDGRELLEFRTRVGDREVHGIDLLTFDDDGLVTDLTVMVRPFRGTQALLEAMGRALAGADA